MIITPTGTKPMQFLLASARNHLHLHNPKDDGLHSAIEIVLTLVANNFEYVGGQLIKVDKTSTVRIVVDAEAARDLAKRLIEWADQSEALSRRITPQPKA
jgi:hypothetical protein